MKIPAKYRNSKPSKVFGWALLIAALVFLYFFSSKILGMFSSIFGVFDGGQKGKDEEAMKKIGNEVLDQVAASVKKGNLKHAPEFYKSIAISQYNNMNGVGTTDVSELVDQLKYLNKDELLTVYTEFGFKVNNFLNVFGWINSQSDNIIQWYKSEIDSSDPHLYELKAIWSRSGLPW